MTADMLRVVVGLVILIVAADRLVIAAVRIAKLLDVSMLIIGAVVVGFGTSIPEFAVSAIAASGGNLSLAMSNVVASNTANLTLVLGSAALIAAIRTKAGVVKREGLLMFGAVAALTLALVDKHVSLLEGAALFVGVIAAILLLITWTNSDDSEHVASESSQLMEMDADGGRAWVEVLVGVMALVATVVAADQLLEGVVSIGESYGLSVVFMGLITGIGTSLPELSAAIAASRRRASDLVLGNVLGSNVFNSLGVAGLAAVIGPGAVFGLTPLLLGMALASAVFAGLFAFTSQRVTRWEGLALIGLFLMYSVASL